MATSLDEIKEIKEMLTIMNKNIERNNQLLHIISSKMDKEVIEECKKMGSHINFVQEVYENVKHPLNYICDIINFNSNFKQINDDTTNPRQICNED